MKISKHILFIPVLLLCAHSASAESLDYTGAAHNMMDIYKFATHIISASLIAIGIAFMGSGCMKLKYHRDNPIQTPLSQPVTLLVMATIMLMFATFIMVSQTYVYGYEDKTASITKIFESKTAGQQTASLPALPTAKPMPQQHAKNDPDYISLDAPLM